MRVAFHAINGVGLGHLVRATAIAEEVRALDPEGAILVLTNAADTSLLRRAGLDFVRFPPSLTEPHADPDRSRRALPGPIEHAALSAALDAFAPDLVVFDTHAPAAVVRRAAEIGARSVLVLRELRPEALAAFLASGAPATFDHIVVPHEPGEVDLRGAAHLPVTVAGPVVRRLETRLPRGKRAARVVMMAGGGGQPVDARRFLRAAADAHILARARIPDLTTLLVTGPYGEAPPHLRGVPGLSVTGACADLPAYLARAELLVSQAGYNSVAEIRALRKPAILVPGRRKAEDQAARARRLCEAGAAVMARADARSIADRIESILLPTGALARMAAAHDERPLVPQNRAVAEAVLRPISAGRVVQRVVLVAHELGPRVGGMETVARALASGLLAKGITVRVYTTRGFGPDGSGLPAGTVRRLYAPGIDLWSDLPVTLDALLTDTPDVIHLCNAGLGPWVPALQAAFPAAVTVNVHGNDLLSPWVQHGGDPAAYRAAQIAGLGAADAVIAVSAFSAGRAAAAGVDPARIHAVHNGVDCTRFQPGAADAFTMGETPKPPPQASLAARLGIEEGSEVVLTVSRLAQRKGHATALRAMAEVLRRRPQALYVYTGENAQISDELGALAAELGVTDRVRAIGFVSEEELPALYRLARVFALLSDEGPTDVEGFGVALIEAAASGLPVVATRSGGIPEAVADGETGVLVPPGDAHATACALEALLDDPQEARAMGARGRARAVARFSTDARVDEVLSRWSAIRRAGVGVRPLAGFAAAFAGEPSPPAAPIPGPAQRALALRRALRAAPSGVALVRLAQKDAIARRAAAAQRRESFAKIVRQGGVVRLRAVESGAALLVEALADCAALCHLPIVEVKLRRFVEPDFLAHAVPLVRSARLLQSVPTAGAAALLERLASLPDAAVAKIHDVRLFLSREARTTPSLAGPAIMEAHALRHLLTGRGVTVVPPAELARYLTETPDEGPLTGMIEPTNICNLSCPTCPTGKGKIAPKPQMSVERFGAVVDALTPRLKTLALWNYGEPLLHRDLPGIIGRAKSAGVRVVKVSSNAHFLDGERGRALLASGLDVLILSVDGASQETYQVFRKGGDFADVSRQIAWLCAEKRRLGQRRPSIEIQFIVMRHNEHEIDDIRRLCAEWGVDRLKIKTVGAEDESTRHLVPTSKLLSRYREDGSHNANHPFCTMAWDHTVVNVDGSVTPCCYLRPDMGDAFVMGNVFETPFAEIWHGERYRAFRSAMLDGRKGMPVCNRCRGGTHDLFTAIEEVGAS